MYRGLGGPGYTVTMESPNCLRPRLLWTGSDILTGWEAVLDAGHITEVRPCTHAPALALPDSLLMPGIINPHTHLDNTVYYGLLPQGDHFRWIRRLVALSHHLTDAERRDSALLGVMLSLRQGITCLGDITTDGVSLDALQTTGLRGRLYLEFTSVTGDTQSRITHYNTRLATLARLCGDSAIAPGISLHSLYTVPWAVWMEADRLFPLTRYPLCVHLLESRDESDLLRHGGGPWARMFERRGIGWSVPADCVQRLAQQSWAHRDVLWVHGVRLRESELNALLPGNALVCCPHSSRTMHEAISLPLQHLMNGGAVCIGTDGAGSGGVFGPLFQFMHLTGASACDPLDLWRRTQQVAAHALRQPIPSIRPGAPADLTVLRIPSEADTPETGVLSALRTHDVQMTLCGGRTAYLHGQYPLLHESWHTVWARVHAAQRRIVAECNAQEATLYDGTTSL